LQKVKSRPRIKPRPRMTVLENPSKRGMVVILSELFTFYFNAVFGNDGLPCRPWISNPTDKPLWKADKEGFYAEDREFLDDIEPQVRCLAIQVVCNYKERLDRRTLRAEKEERNKTLQGKLPGFLA